jgi:hypothetical protein
MLAGLGMTRPQIADIIGCSEDTLRSHFERALRVGDSEAKAKVAQALFVAATGWMKQDPVSGKMSGEPGTGAMSAIIWYEKTRAGRSDSVKIDAQHSGEITTGASTATEEAVRDAIGKLDELAARLAGGGTAGAVAPNGLAVFGTPAAALAAGGLVDGDVDGGPRLRED